jgi:beta-phosphoglucomutase-like phosphatase (HAD superfamily)
VIDLTTLPTAVVFDCDGTLTDEDVVATLAALREHGMPLAVCTSLGRAHLDRVLSVRPLKSN